MRFKNYYLFAYIVFSVLDIYLRISLNYQLPVYSRVSIFFGTLAFICMAYSLKISKMKFVQLLSKYSLGIFALHKYWQYLFILIINRPEFSNFNLPFFGGILALVPVAISLMTVTFTFLSIYLLNLIGLKTFVS